jgi:hypothetical protein
MYLYSILKKILSYSLEPEQLSAADKITSQQKKRAGKLSRRLFLTVEHATFSVSVFYKFPSQHIHIYLYTYIFTSLYYNTTHQVKMDASAMDAFPELRAAQEAAAADALDLHSAVGGDEGIHAITEEARERITDVGLDDDELAELIQCIQDLGTYNTEHGDFQNGDQAPGTCSF